LNIILAVRVHAKRLIHVKTPPGGVTALSVLCSYVADKSEVAQKHLNMNLLLNTVMELFECIEKRRSVRKYLDRPVEWEKVGNILRAGQHAPSAGNLQDWRFVVVTDLMTRKKIADAAYKQYWLEECPVLIVVCSDPEKTKMFYKDRGEKFYTIQNCAAAIQNMLLAATDQELGSCWVGAFDIELLKTAVAIPQHVIPHAIIALGYAAEEPVKPQMFRIDDITFIQNFNRRVANIDLALQNWGEVVRKKLHEAKEKTQKEAKKKAPVIKDRIAHHIKNAREKIKSGLKKKVE
jgi:nitroreductase